MLDSADLRGPINSGIINDIKRIVSKGPIQHNALCIELLKPDRKLDTIEARITELTRQGYLDKSGKWHRKVDSRVYTLGVQWNGSKV